MDKESPIYGSALASPATREVLAELHGDARRDFRHYPRVGLSLLLDRIRGVRQTSAIRYGKMRDLYLAVTESQGRFLYLTARALGARRVVEFGAAFGLSTIYLAAAVKDNGGGRVITSEIEQDKAVQAMANIRKAGLSEHVEMRVGDAEQTLTRLDHDLDLIFLDGWEPLYLPLVQALGPRLRRGGVVIADDVVQYRKQLRDYVAHVRDVRNGYQSVTVHVPFWRALEYSVRL
ncbi:O-methyltransferase [Planctomycetota bacterium]